MVDVKQVDRDAAMKVETSGYLQGRIAKKLADSHYAVQAFAAHRQALISQLREPSEGVVEAMMREAYSKVDDQDFDWEEEKAKAPDAYQEVYDLMVTLLNVAADALDGGG